MKYGKQYLILKRNKQTCVSGVSRSASERNDWKEVCSSGPGTALPCDEQKRLARGDAERAPELRVVPVRHWMKNDRGEGHWKG